MQHKVGLVLSGGGGKGAYEIGVIKALVESGISKNIAAISGTSVGALNMALFLQNNVPLAEKVWLSLSPLKVFSIHTDDVFQKIYEMASISGLHPSLHGWLYNLVTEGIFSRYGLSQIIDEHINLALIKNSRISCFATCCQLSNWHTEYFKLNNLTTSKIKDVLLASSAIPLVFPPQIIDGHKYVDGGLPHPFGDNTPIIRVYEEGCAIILVVHLDPDNRTDPSIFPGTRIIDIFPSSNLGGLHGTFNFNSLTIRSRINLGYKNTLSVIESEKLQGK